MLAQQRIKTPQGAGLCTAPALEASMSDRITPQQPMPRMADRRAALFRESPARPDRAAGARHRLGAEAAAAQRRSPDLAKLLAHDVLAADYALPDPETARARRACRHRSRSLGADIGRGLLSAACFRSRTSRR